MPSNSANNISPREQQPQSTDQHKITNDINTYSPLSLITFPFKKVLSLIIACYHLFFARSFQAHRLFGLLYLCQWFTALIWYFKNYETFSQSMIILTLPLNGILQSVSATFYFRFLPKKTDAGYYSDKFSLSYSFVVENIFYSSLLCFQWLYYSNHLSKYIPYFVEIFFVFLPYFVRPLFPKTSFRDSSVNKRNTTQSNQIFYYYAHMATKCFYIWAKHFIGFYLNYMRFLDRVTSEQQYHVYLMLILSCWATTTALFTHTLAVKYYITRRTSFVIYIVSYMSTFYSWYQMSGIFLENWDLVLLTFGGLIINFASRKWQYLYQIVMLFVLTVYIVN